MNFLTDYKNELVKRIKMIKGDSISDEYIENIVKDEMKKRIVNEKLKNDNRDVILFNDQNVTILNLINWIGENKPILTGFGSVYKNHYQSENDLADMIKMLLDTRKVYKKEMFKYVNAKTEDEIALRDMYNLFQLTMKKSANSFYGASIEKNCIFYNPYFGPSITYTGVIIITTAVNIFEKFIANNIIFRKVSDIYEYCYNILNEVYNFEVDVKDISVETLHSYLLSKLKNSSNCSENQSTTLFNFLYNLNQNEINKIYYKNNLEIIIENSNEIKNILSRIICNDDFTNPNKVPDNIIDDLELLWNHLEKYVYYNNLDFYRFQNADKEVRKSVLTIDTDSNFCVPRCA